MGYWIFTVTGHKLEDESYLPEDILRQRLQDKFWGLGEKTPNRCSLQEGDFVVFYLGLPHKVFAATATLASDSYQLSEDERDAVSHGTKFYRAQYGVRLTDVQIWPERRRVEDLVPFLRFIENKTSWFAYFQGGVRQVSEEDFQAIIQNRVPLERKQPASIVDIENEAQFALESHLEEFIDKNWKSIDFGSALVRYETDDQNGRQFPAGPWSIDFLCLEKNTGDFVVVELKRGKSSDSTVGQLLRYMSWVKENLAKTNQKVRGIIIATTYFTTLRKTIMKQAI